MKISQLDSLTSVSAHEVATIHETMPREWLPGHNIDKHRIAETTKRLQCNSNQKQIFLLQEMTGQIRGFHWIEIKSGKAFLISTWINSALRRSGQATRLKMLGEHWVRSFGIKMLRSRVHKSNQAMLLFTQREGFHPVGEENGYLIFEKEI